MQNSALVQVVAVCPSLSWCTSLLQKLNRQIEWNSVKVQIVSTLRSQYLFTYLHAHCVWFVALWGFVSSILQGVKKGVKTAVCKQEWNSSRSYSLFEEGVQLKELTTSLLSSGDSCIQSFQAEPYSKQKLLGTTSLCFALYMCWRG